MDNEISRILKISKLSEKESKIIFKKIVENLDNEEELRVYLTKIIKSNELNYKNINITVDPKELVNSIIEQIKFNYKTDALLNLKNQKLLIEQSERINKKIKIKGKECEFEIIKIPKGTKIFKSLPEYQNNNKNKSYWNDSIPTWYGSYLTSIMYSTEFLNVYTTLDDIYLFDLNSQINYKTINELELFSIYKKKVYKTETLNDILSYYYNCQTSLCKRYNKYGYWIYSFLISNIIKELYGIKKLKINNYNISPNYVDEDLLIFKELKELVDILNINGFYSGQGYNPISLISHFFGIYIEEIIIYKKNGIIERDITNPLDTYQFLKNNGIKIPNNFIFSDGYIYKNQNNQLLKFYCENIKLYGKKVPSNNLILTLNVHQYISINKNDKNNIYELLNLIKNINCSLICLPESLLNKTHLFKNYKVFNSKTENLKDNSCLTLLYKDIDVKHIFEKQLPNNVKTIRKMICLTTHNNKFIFTHLEIKDGMRLNQLKFILKYNPDFIIGDLNFNEKSKEYDFLKNKGYKTIKSKLKTTPFNTTVDYIWFKNNKGFKQTIIPYPYSDHRGVLLSLL